MAITLSHQSALDLIRTHRSDGLDVKAFDATSLAEPRLWTGKQWSMRTFLSDEWKWMRPDNAHPLHVLVPQQVGRIGARIVKNHTSWRALPPGSVLWVDQVTRMVSPELLFAQMAEVLSLPALVMLGYELCGHFSRCAEEPLNGDAAMEIPSATSVGDLASYLSKFRGGRNVRKASKALDYIHDDAVSPAEAVLSTMYSLPWQESGYGMRIESLNAKVGVYDPDNWSGAKTRYPDIMFSFAPIGLNYDGEKDHLDLVGLFEAVQRALRSDGDEQAMAMSDFRSRLNAVRSKVVDDNVRNRQLAASGRIVFPVTKEDISDRRHLDSLTRQILHTAHAVFHVDTDELERMLDDTDGQRARQELLDMITPSGGAWGSSYGKV